MSATAVNGILLPGRSTMLGRWACRRSAERSNNDTGEGAGARRLARREREGRGGRLPLRRHRRLKAEGRGGGVRGGHRAVQGWPSVELWRLVQSSGVARRGTGYGGTGLEQRRPSRSSRDVGPRPRGAAVRSSGCSEPRSSATWTAARLAAVDFFIFYSI
ncbi:hypothetical protein PVAP13_8KG251200 [Panicum virgatum]|uniref:Uncharacterized protein n=1 Tax=Panicum virgatum TaxID=38727 RepID=A0A8T0PXR6_PANVG|nr:hypothetical protein PVAP13_8KG251200 [Panicum virgatum]